MKSEQEIKYLLERQQAEKENLIRIRANTNSDDEFVARCFDEACASGAINALRWILEIE